MRTTFLFAALLTACAGSQHDAAQRTSAEDLSFAGDGGSWTIYELTNGAPNPAKDIQGSVFGIVSPEINQTRITLIATGLPPNQTFGAHVHTQACNDNQAGGHYEQQAGVVSPDSETWLDLTTDAAGFAYSDATHPYAIREAEAKAIVVHADPTDHTTGKAGAKLACIDLVFDDM
jgi:Cu/Zn superoxide dismutase